MASDFLIEGLKEALARGETLKQAMMTFFNAGYLTHEIEEAARALQQEQVQNVQQAAAPTRQQTFQPPIPQKNNAPVPMVNSPPQNVSAYVQPPRKSKAAIILIIILLIISLGALAFILIFKEDVLNFLNLL